MPLTKQETLKVFQTVELDGWSGEEQEIWARGMCDALQVLNRFPQDEEVARQFAEAAAKL